MRQLLLIPRVFFKSFFLHLQSGKERLIEWSVMCFFLMLIMTLCFGIWGEAISSEQRYQWIWYLVFTEALILPIQSFNQIMETELTEKPPYLFLLRPLQYGWFHWSQAFAKVCVSFCVLSFIGSCYAYYLVGKPPLSFFHWLRFSPFCLMALGFNTLIIILFGLLSVWFGYSLILFTLWRQVLFFAGGLLFPLSHYPEALRQFFLYTPFPYLLGLPAEYIVKIPSLDFQTAFIILMGWIGTLIWIFSWIQKAFIKKVS